MSGMKAIRQSILIGCLAVGSGTIASCSLWDVIKPSSGLSVDTELVIGDKQQVVHTELGQTVNTADEIIIQNDNVDYTMLGLLLLSVGTGVAGWMLPVPKFMRKE